MSGSLTPLLGFSRCVRVPPVRRAVRPGTGREARDKRIFAMWLACQTQQEIADAEGVTKETVSEIVSQKSADLPQSDKVASEHATDFEPPIYNIWKQQDRTPGGSHFGNSETRWVDNLLYLYTQPFDIVVDPFAGSGSTADICKKRCRAVLGQPGRSQRSVALSGR